MKPVTYHSAFADEWREIERLHAGLARLLFFVVLPASFVLPAMVYFTGLNQAVALLPQVERDWGLIASAFFLVEWVTLLIAGWLIGQVARTCGVRIGYAEAFRLAGIWPLPLWLSSLGLLIPNAAFSAAAFVAAFGMSCTLLYQGIARLSPSGDRLTAISITQTVVSAGLIVWVLTLTLVMLV